MSLLLALGLLLVGTVLLLWGADWLLDGVRELAEELKVSSLVLGIILVGLEPEEMVTGAIASAQGAGHLALGNVVGTNITILTLALGLAAVLAPLVLNSSLRRQAVITTLVSSVPIVLLLLGPLNRIVGVLLLLLFGVYIFVLLRTDRQTLLHLSSEDQDQKDHDVTKSEKSSASTGRLPVQGRHLLTTLAGLVALALGGPAIVRGALLLTESLGLGQDVIGGTIVALGTGSEMIALGATAARKQQTDVLVGGVLGSFAYNLLITLGLAALIHPLPELPLFFRWAVVLMAVAQLLLLALLWRGKIGRVVGALAIIMYVGYLVVALLSGALNSA